MGRLVKSPRCVVFAVPIESDADCFVSTIEGDCPSWVHISREQANNQKEYCKRSKTERLWGNGLRNDLLGVLEKKRETLERIRVKATCFRGTSNVSILLDRANWKAGVEETREMPNRMTHVCIRDTDRIPGCIVRTFCRRNSVNTGTCPTHRTRPSRFPVPNSRTACSPGTRCSRPDTCRTWVRRTRLCTCTARCSCRTLPAPIRSSRNCSLRTENERHWHVANGHCFENNNNNVTSACGKLVVSVIAFVARQVAVAAVAWTLPGGLVAHWVPGSDLVAIARCDRVNKK